MDVEVDFEFHYWSTDLNETKEHGGGHSLGMCDDDTANLGVQSAALNHALVGRFRVFPVSDIDCPDLECGDKIVLPSCVQDNQAFLNEKNDLVLQLEALSGCKSHCGVRDFSAHEGHVNLPSWMMRSIGAKESELITVRIATLPEGTHVKLQPQSSAFLDISNPDASVKSTLRKFTCLTKGDSIRVSYDEKTLYFGVLGVAPGDAVCIVDADLDVEFALLEPDTCTSDTSTSSESIHASKEQYRPEYQEARHTKASVPGAGASASGGGVHNDSSDENDSSTVPRIAEKQSNLLIFGNGSSLNAQHIKPPNRTSAVDAQDPAERLRARLAKLTRRDDRTGSSAGLGSDEDSSNEDEPPVRRPKRVVYSHRSRTIKGKKFQAVGGKGRSASGCCNGKCKCSDETQQP